MLQNLDSFLDENKKDIFAFIENSRRPINLDYDGNNFEMSLPHLVTSFPVCHCNPPQPTHAEFGKAHYELAVTIPVCVVPQLKENKKWYPSGTTENFRQILSDASDAGRRYGPIEEAHRQEDVGRTLNSR